MARPRTGTITTIKIPRPRPPLFRTAMLVLHRACLLSSRGRHRRMAMWGPSRARPRAARAQCPARPRRRTIVTRPRSRRRTRTTVWPLHREQATVAGTTGGGTRDQLGISLGILACLFLFSFRCMPLPVSAAKQISVFILILILILIRGWSVIDARNADIAGTSRTWTRA